MWKLVKYRGKWCAYKATPTGAIRRSSGSENYELAKPWFDDFLRIQSAPQGTFKEVYEAYKEKVSPNEKKKMNIMQDNIYSHFGGFRADQIDGEKAKSYAEYRAAQNISNNTIIRELGSVRSALRAFDRNLPKTWYMPPKPEPKDRYLTREEFNTLIDAAISPHIKLFIRLALATGARTGAILELTWPQIDFKRGFVDLGKGAHNKRRSKVPLNEKALEALKKAYEFRTCDNVIEYGSKPVKSIRKGFDLARDNAGLGKDVTPHVIRHSAAIWMVEAGITITEVAQYLGHTNPQITYSTYARYSPDYLRKASDILQ